MVSPDLQLVMLMDGFLTTQLLYVAAKLGVAEALRQGPRTGAEVAEAIGAEPRALTRVLRGLAVDGIIDEQADGRFALSELGARLPDLRGSIIARGELYYHAAPGLLEAVRDGGVAFERVFDEPFFEHLDRRPEHQTAFESSMAVRSEREAHEVAAAYDFTQFRRLVDVGGGRGVLMSAILRSAPDLQGVLLERPAAVVQARRRLEADGLASRCECVEGDFFSSVPAGADVYLLSRIIHDWDDTDAVRILETCRVAVPDGGRLVLVEALLPERAVEDPAAIRMDLHMLILFGSSERSEAEYRRVLADASFELARTVATHSGAAVTVIEAIPV